MSRLPLSLASPLVWLPSTVNQNERRPVTFRLSEIWLVTVSPNMLAAQPPRSREVVKLPEASPTAPTGPSPVRKALSPLGTASPEARL
jgi:hypothetical protein